MANLDIIRAWKDEDFRRSLTEDERAQLPEHPSGAVELQDTQRGEALGYMVLAPSRGRRCTR